MNRREFGHRIAWNFIDKTLPLWYTTEYKSGSLRANRRSTPGLVNCVTDWKQRYGVIRILPVGVHNGSQWAEGKRPIP
jgi:hypothetical protein